VVSTDAIYDEIGKFSQEDRSDTAMGTQEPLGPSESQFVVHGRDGSYLMNKCRWPKLDLPSGSILQDSEGVEGLTHEESLVILSPNLGGTDSQHSLVMGKEKATISQMVSPMESMCGEDLMEITSIMGKDSDEEGDDLGWQAPKSKKSKKTKKVVAATRTSSRVPRDGVPIATKATQRAMARNTVSGTTHNSFIILNSTPNFILQSIITDLDLEIENMDEQLDAFKTEEIVRAKIA
jgi:hypothetical protein